MKEPNWTLTEPERALMRAIMARARREFADMSLTKGEWRALQMDLTACHNHAQRLDLRRLLKADGATFGHDVLGVRRFLDRDKLKLGGNFRPRTSLSTEQKKQRMRGYANEAKRYRKPDEIGKRIQAANLWRELATDREAAKAPAYLCWYGRQHNPGAAKGKAPAVLIEVLRPFAELDRVISISFPTCAEAISSFQAEPFGEIQLTRTALREAGEWFAALGGELTEPAGVPEFGALE